MKTDQFLLSIFGGLTYVGAFQIASRICFLFQNLSSQFLESIIPMSAKYTKGEHADKEMLKLLIRYSVKINIYIATCGLLTFLMSADYLFKYWLDIEDNSIYITSIVLIFTVYIKLVGKIVLKRFGLITNEENRLAKLSTLEAIFNLIFSLIFIPQMGILGAALGTLIPQIAICIVCYIPRLKTKYKLSIGKDYLRPIATSLSLGMITCLPIRYLLNTTRLNIYILLIYMLLYGILYIIIVTPFYLDKDERSLLVTAAAKKLKYLKRIKCKRIFIENQNEQ